MSTENRNTYGQPSVTKKQHELLSLQVKVLSSDPIGRPSNSSFSSAARYAGLTSSGSQSIDDLTSQLSRTRIEPESSSKKHWSPTVTSTQYKDTIDQVIREVLPRDLKVAGSERLLPNHPCFELARQYAKKWHISDEAVQSHIKLACGY